MVRLPQKETNESRDYLLKEILSHQFLLEAMPEALLIIDQHSIIQAVNQKTEKLFGYSASELIGQPVEFLIPIALRESHQNQLDQYNQNPQSRNMNSGLNYSGLRKDGGKFNADIELKPVPIKDGFYIIASIRDVTERVETQKSLADKLAQLETLHQISVAISSPHGVDDLLRLIVEQAVELLDASSCSVLMPDWDTGELVFRASVDDIVGLRIPPGKGVVSRVLKTGQAEFIADVSQDVDHFGEIDRVTEIQTHSLLVAPLSVDGRPIGVITAINKKNGDFNQADCDLFSTLASYAAMSIHKARLYEQIQEHATELERKVARRTASLRASEATLKERNLELNRLYRASETLFFSSAPVLEELGKTIVKTILGEFGQSNCSLLLLNETGDDLTQIAIMGPYATEASENKIRLDGLGSVAAAIRLGKMTNMPDVPNKTDYTPRWKDARSELAIPLKIGSRVIGVIDIQSKSINAFSAEDERLISVFAERAALALEHARLFSAERSLREEAETLRQAGAVVAATLRQDEAIERILVELERVVPYDSASVQLLRDDVLEIVGGRGWDDLEMVRGVCFPIPGNNPNTLVVQQRKAIIIDDTRHQYAPFKEHPHDHIYSWLGAPLIVRDRVIGMLAVDSKVPHFYTESHKRLVTAFAAHVAIAVDNAQLFEKTQSTLAETQMLYNIARSLIHTENLNELLSNLVESVAKALPADKVILITVTESIDDIQKIVKGGAGADSISDQDIKNMFWEEGLCRWVLKELKPALSPKGSVDPRMGVDAQRQRIRLKCGAIITVPLLYRGEVLGTLTVTNRYDQADFTLHEVSLLETIANQTAIAIENARLFEEIQWLATTDSLTGINNRRRFFELGRIEIERARRYQHPLSVIMLDIDQFKTINDTYGHALGDTVLSELAQGCRLSVREFDIVGRYGGEEFAIILPTTELAEAIATADRLRLWVAAQVFATSEGGASVTISLGVAELTPDLPDLATLLDRADSALYAAKQAGRNCVRSYG